MFKNIVIAVLCVATIWMTFFAWTQKQAAEEAQALSMQNEARVEQCLMEAQHQRMIAQQQRMIAGHTLQMLKQAQDTIRHQVEVIKANASWRKTY